MSSAVNRTCRLLLCCVLLSHIKGISSRPVESVSVSEDEGYQRAFMEDCDWTGMTRDAIVAQNAVQLQALRCGSGRINWLYPAGAVQLALHVPENFDQFSTENKTTSPKEICLTFEPDAFKQIQIHLLKDKRMELVHSPLKPNGEKSSRKCFEAKDKVTRVLLEKIPENGSRNRRATDEMFLKGTAELLYEFV